MLSSLAKKNEPVEMFRLAEMHLRAAGIISRKKLKNNNLSNNPAHVLLAFSLELYLKCLITLEGHLPRHIHQGHKLFSQLNGKTQNRLRSDFQTICKFDYAIY